MATFKRDHSEFTQDGITIKGNYNKVRGKGCTIIGDYNHIYGEDSNGTGDYNHFYGDGCTGKGDHNHFYSKNCNVYGDYCHDHGSNNYLGKGDYSKGSFSASKPFSANKPEPVQYVQRSDLEMVDIYTRQPTSQYEKKLNFELPDNRIQSGSSQLLTVREETTMSSDGKKVELTTGAKMQAIAEKARRASAKAVKDDADNAVIEAYEDLKAALEKIRLDAEQQSDATIELMYEQLIDSEKAEEAKRKAEKEKKAAELVKQAEARRVAKKRELEEAEAAKKADDEATKRNIGLLSGLLNQLGGGAAQTATSAPAPPSK